MKIRQLCSKISITPIGIPVPKIKLDTKNCVINIIVEYNITDNTTSKKKKLKESLNTLDVYNILKNISDEDWYFLGFTKQYRPEDLLIINLPISPVTIRPSLKTEFLIANTYEDSLNHIYIEIIRSNNKIKKYDKNINNILENKNGIKDSIENILQCHIIAIFSNDSLSVPPIGQKIGGRPVKSISERIQSKEGRIRKNLMGKRVDFSGRTVITPDPNININELGVPIKMAMNLTFPEMVTYNNLNKLQKLVDNGRTKYPGANYIKRNNTVIDLRYRKNVKLFMGDIVDRHLIDRDYVLFNRQPSLHKLSMMGHSIRIINDKSLYTFRLNVSSTTPYNADFDGDEMNIFVPQCIETTNELKKIANLQYQIISPGDSRPIISFVQDTVLGIYKLTRDNVNINWRDMMNLIIYCKGIKLDNITKNKVYTGKYIYSKLIYDNINLDKDGVKIINGKLLNGPLKKGNCKTLIGNIWYKNGSSYTRDFIFNSQRLICNWLLMEGFSVGIGDLIINNKIEIIKEIEKKKMEVNQLITEIENNPELSDIKTFEETLTSNLSANKGVIEKLVMKNLSKNNNFNIMVTSGSKGAKINIMQMVGAMGQDILEFKRIPKQVDNRSLPHIFQNDDRAVARGYIEHSYLDGLNPQEFFFHNMTTREGIIDTAIKTSETGYISRKLMKAMEDIMIRYDGTVRNDRNVILQFVYGDNNVNQIKQTMQKINFINKNNKEIKEIYTFNSKEITDLSKKFNIKNLNKLNNDFYNKILKMRYELLVIQSKFIQNYVILIDMFSSPVNFKLLIMDIVNYKNINDKNESINPLYIYDKIDYILSHKTTIFLNLNDTNKTKLKNDKELKYLFKMLLYEYLSPKKIIYEYKLSKFKFDYLVNQIIDEFNNSLVESGEMVGSLGAQHIGEPSTQMTLNTFHATGSGVVGMQGVPRLRELMHSSKNIQTPNMEIYLLDKQNYNMALETKSNLILTKMNDIIDEYSLIFDSSNDGINKKDNVSNIIHLYSKITNLEYIPFVLRLVLNKNALLINSLTIFEIKTRFIKLWKEKYSNTKNIKRNLKEVITNISECGIMGNDELSDELIIHIRFNIRKYSSENLTKFKNFILDFQIKGIDNIDKIGLPIHKEFIYFDKEKIENKKQYLLVSEGQNIIDIRYIKNIDLYKTITNDVNIIYKYFGIEAARNCLIKEMTAVFRNAGNDVNYHHLSLLIDLITNIGKLVAIDRFGLNKLEGDPLSKASFEKTIDILLNAAIYNKTDTNQSVSSRIMTGRAIKGGTGCFDLLFDNKIVENSEMVDKELLDEQYSLLFEENELFNYIIKQTCIDCFIP